MSPTYQASTDPADLLRQLQHLAADIREFCDSDVSDGVSIEEWKNCVGRRPPILAFPWPFHFTVNPNDKNSAIWCGEFPDAPHLPSICDADGQLYRDIINHLSSALLNKDIKEASGGAGFGGGGGPLGGGPDQGRLCQ